MHNDALDRAYILHSRPYGETSLILEIFTETQGRLSLIVRGARAKKPRRGGMLQAFSPLLVSYFGRTELKTAKSIEYAGSPLTLIGDRLLIGLYVNELLYFLLGKYEEMSALFASYHALMENLAKPSFEESMLRKFEIILLKELGYGLAFNIILLTGGRIKADGYYDFAAEEGFKEVRYQHGQAGIYPGASLLEIADMNFSNQNTLMVAKKVLREALAFRLGGRRLKSRDLFIRSVGDS